MDEGRRYVRLGLFVVMSFSLLAVVLFVLGGRKLFQPTFTFETYFNASVAGLELGAPVRFRGVPLGQVSEIVTSASVYEKDIPLPERRAYIVVRAKVNVSAAEATQMQHDVAQLVNRGLRAQTQLAGITGQLYLGLGLLDPAKNPSLEFPWKPRYTYIPSAPSLTAQIIANAQALLANLNEVDLKSLSGNLNAVLVDLDKKLNDPAVGELLAKADDFLKITNATFERIDRILATAPIDQMLRKLDAASGRLDTLLADPSLKQTLDDVAAISARVRKLTDSGDLERLVKRLDDMTARLDALIGDNQYDVSVIVQDLRVTASNVRALSEMAKRYPAGMLLGGPPEKIQLPGSSR